MYIKELKIENFRGIREFKNTFDNKVICLIGASDSTKTTLLDAIEFALYPSWNINVTNTDFYQCNLDNMIKIQITIGNIPEYFLNEDTFGFYIRKYVINDTENDEPSTEDEIFLTIQLTINELFEPEWKVITNRGIEKTINHRDRARFPIARIGENIEKDFYIGRNSILKSYFNDTKELNSQLFALLQNIKKQDIDTTGLQDKFDNIKKIIDDYNIKLNSNLNLKIEMRSSDLNVSNVGISDGIIPLNRKGTGTKRLLSSILNLESKNNDSCILIDEIEYGLEPYRIADLLFKLKEKNRQSIITTHSPIPLTELDCDCIKICRSKEGLTQCISISSDLQSLIRTFPFAFLSRKILITEGATEWGILRAHNEEWSKFSFSFAYSGGFILDGHGGARTIKYAKEFKKLGYDVGIFIDSDDNDTNLQASNLNDIKVFKFEDGYNTEKKILEDIKCENYHKIIEVLKNIRDEDYVNNLLITEFGTFDIDEILNRENKKVIDGLYKIMTKKDSKGKDIFKGTNYGIMLGKQIIELSSTDFTSSKIISLIDNIRKWCHDIK